MRHPSIKERRKTLNEKDPKMIELERKMKKIINESKVFEDVLKRNPILRLVSILKSELKDAAEEDIYSVLCSILNRTYPGWGFGISISGDGGIQIVVTSIPLTLWEA